MSIYLKMQKKLGTIICLLLNLPLNDAKVSAFKIFVKKKRKEKKTIQKTDIT